MWYCDKSEWDPEGMRSKLSLSSTLPTPLGNKLLNFLSVQLPPAWMKRSDKTDQDIKVGMLNEDRSRVKAARQGRGRLDFFLNIFFTVNKWTTETSFISRIKYCYLQYPCCLLCNPTTWVNQINTLRLGHNKTLRAVKTCLHQRHKHKHKLSADVTAQE